MGSIKRRNQYRMEMKNVPRFNFVQVKISKQEALEDRVREIADLIHGLNNLIASPLPKTKGQYQRVKPGHKGYKKATYEGAWGPGNGPVFPMICSDKVSKILTKKMKNK